MTTVTELAAKLDLVNAQLAKASKEIVEQVAKLELALSDATLSVETEQALNNLVSLAQALDDLNQDVV